jgi:hypothetical protein
VLLKRERVEMVEARAYYRCPECDASFLVRWEDAVALGVVPPGSDPDETEDEAAATGLPGSS